MSGRRRDGWRRAGAVAVLVPLLVLGACGDDEATPSVGEEVEGRVPDPAAPGLGSTTTGEPDGTTTSGVSGMTAPTTAAPPTVALGDVTVALTEVAQLDAPTKLVGRPDSDLLYVALQGGRVVALAAEGDRLVERSTALDVTAQTASGGERGLLGLAFSPDGNTLYVHHSGRDGSTRVASYPMDGDVADASARTDLLTVPQPYPNHNGGDIVVGPDGHLWIGLGDGGSAGDPEDRAQDADELLGKVLRIDPTTPSEGRAYGIPSDNPYASGGGRPEIAVTGVRNPWRLRFDAATGDLWVADVGQNAWEELDRLAAGSILGANLGWSRFEGSSVYDASREVRGGELVGPVFEMSHDDGWCSVTGGLVYRGTDVPGLAGAYLFGDYCRTGLSAVRLGADGTVAETAVLDGDASSLVSIDADLDGEVYLLSLEGAILRLGAG